MTPQWLLLYRSADMTGFAVELVEPKPLRVGGRPRPFTPGPPGKRFDIGLQTDREGMAYRLLQQSADIGGQQAYELLYAEGYIRHEASARFRLQADGLSDFELTNVAGRSADLLFALAVIMAALPRVGDYPPLAATGVLNEEGRIQSVDGVSAKLRAALAVLPAGGKVFYPLINEPEIDAALRELALTKQIELIPVERLDEVVSEHLGIKVEKAWLGAPYRRLESFSEQQRRIFFGREADSLVLKEKLIQREQLGRPGILILGASGRGKSSLVQAGLIPQLKQTLVNRSLLYAIWRPGAAEKLDESALADSIRRHWSQLPGLSKLIQGRNNLPSTEQDENANAASLQQLSQDLANLLAPDTRFLWVLNQMEELFTQIIPEATLAAFYAFLHTLQRQGVWVIGTLRSEFFHNYAQQEHLFDMFDDGGIYNLRELNATALERLIRGPAELSGLHFETDPATDHNLALQLRDDALAGGSDVLPLLEFTLNRLYELRDTENGLLTFAAYQSIGGLEGAIANYAETLMLAFTSEEQQALPEVLSRLVRLSDDGIDARRQSARRLSFSGNLIHNSLVEKLIDGRLIISSNDIRSKENVVELVHDCLLKVWGEVQRAIDIHRHLLEEKRKLTNAAKHWDDEGRPKSLLFSKAKEVMEAEVVAACVDNDIDMRTQTFLLESINLTRTENRLLWPLMVITIFVGIYSIVPEAFFKEMPFIGLAITTLIASAPLFWLIRKLPAQTYLATARSDLILAYVYLCFLILISSRIIPTTVPTYFSFGYLIAYLVAFIPPYLLIKNIIYKRRAVASVKRKRIGKTPRKPWFSRFKNLFSHSVWTWQKVEIAVWVMIGMMLYGTWGLSLVGDYKTSAAELSTFHISKAEQDLEHGQIKEAIQHLDRAGETMYQFMDAKIPVPEGYDMKWHNENIATELTPMLLNSCKLDINAKIPAQALVYCELAAKISRYWLTNKKSVKETDWQNNLAVAQSKAGLAQIALNKFNGAMAAQVEAKKLLEQLISIVPDTLVYQYNLGVVLKRIGDIHYKTGAKDLAQQHYRDAQKMLAPLVNVKNAGFDITKELLDLYNSIAAVAKELNDNQTRHEALIAARSLLENARKAALNVFWGNQALEEIRKQIQTN